MSSFQGTRANSVKEIKKLAQGYVVKDEYCKKHLPSEAICIHLYEFLQGNEHPRHLFLKGRGESAVNALFVGLLTQFSD